MNIDAFLTAQDDLADSIMGTRSMVVAGQTFNVVVDDVSTAQEGAFGGLEGDVQSVATAQAADVTGPKSLLGKRCTVGGESYRIVQVRSGTVAVHFSLADPNEPR